MNSNDGAHEPLDKHTKGKARCVLRAARACRESLVEVRRTIDGRREYMGQCVALSIF